MESLVSFLKGTILLVFLLGVGFPTVLRLMIKNIGGEPNSQIASLNRKIQDLNNEISVLEIDLKGMQDSLYEQGLVLQQTEEQLIAAQKQARDSSIQLAAVRGTLQATEAERALAEDRYETEHNKTVMLEGSLKTAWAQIAILEEKVDELGPLADKVLTIQRTAASYHAAALIAFLTGVIILVIRRWRMLRAVSQKRPVLRRLFPNAQKMA